MIAAPRQQENLNTRQRWISLSEFLVGGAIVIAHNVYHRVPNEVPSLFVLGWISIQLRNGGWSQGGSPYIKPYIKDGAQEKALGISGTGRIADKNPLLGTLAALLSAPQPTRSARNQPVPSEQQTLQSLVARPLRARFPSAKQLLVTSDSD